MVTGVGRKFTSEFLSTVFPVIFLKSKVDYLSIKFDDLGILLGYLPHQCCTSFIHFILGHYIIYGCHISPFVKY